MTAYTGTVLGDPRWTPGATIVASGSYALTGAVVTGDTFTFPNIIPAQKVKIVGVRIFGVELDTNATPTATLIAGDGTTTNGYLTSVTAGDATGQMQFFGNGALIGTENAASRNLVLALGGTVATAASTGTIFAEVTYQCSNGDRIA